MSDYTELAIHLRSADQRDGLEEWQEHLAGLCNCAATIEAISGPIQSFDRIYVGDEFCPNRLPTLAELKSLLRLSRELEKKISFLTPVVTDEEFPKLSQLLDCLHENHQTAEVVFNDWGGMLFLKETYPDFRLSAGRLLNKGFKDPRLSDPENFSALSKVSEALLNNSSFDQSGLQGVLKENGVVRMERDLLPYAKRQPNTVSGFDTSLYFPFGYLTTGRVCWIAAFRQAPDRRFVPLKECGRPCYTGALRLHSKDLSLPVIQSGNTLYYLYSPSMLATMMEESKREHIRLVYQGFAI